MDKNSAFILWFDQLGIEDVPLVGGKNASLGEMYRELIHKDVPIPNGFALTAAAYRYFFEKSGLKQQIQDILQNLNTKDIENLQECGRKVRSAILAAQLPQELIEPVLKAYKDLSKAYNVENVDVAVRSSATAEDLPDASFAGQQETFLNIKGDIELVDAVKRCIASLFTNRAISYREDKGFDHFSIALSVGVQKMVRSDLACSGVMFSIDTESGFKDAIFITGAYGLGENVVQGAVNPDEYYVFKPKLKEGFKPILSKKVGEKAIKMIYTEDYKHPTKNVDVPQEQREKFCLSDEEVLTLARFAATIEDHYSQKAGKFKPMDMEWAKDGQTNKLFIVQARPETVVSQRDQTTYKKYHLQEQGKTLIEGKSVGSLIGSGKVNVIKDVKDINKFQKGEVLVTDMTDPDWEPIMKIASAIVTNRGGRTCFSKDTKLLTNQGFMTFQDVYNKGYEGLKVPSLNRSTLKIEWQDVQAVMKKQGELIKVSCSQKADMPNNTLKITPDHKMLNLHAANLVDTQIKDMLKVNEALLVAQKIPQLNASTQKDKALAYLLGGIMSDGHIYRSKTRGEVAFIQKPTKEKQEFIKKMNNSLKKVYNKEFKETVKKPSNGYIRGEQVIGSANKYRCYSKQIALELHQESQNITQNLLMADDVLSYHFLAGVIDGDGTYNNGRINIYISKQEVLESVIVACLRIGIVPQVTQNRTIHNVQIVEKLDILNKYTQRVRCKDTRKVGTRFFNAKQLFDANVNSNINNRVRKNLLVDEIALKKTLSCIKNKEHIEKLLQSDIRQYRVRHEENIGIADVYNITVKDNHNYIVFTEKYSPILVNNCHAAIISRELGIPCVVGTQNGTEKLEATHEVTVDCSSGEVGYIYDGKLQFNIEEVNLEQIPRCKTKIMMNLGNPDQAFQTSFIPNDGVGLAREEFIINSYIKTHPLALLQFDQLKDENARKEILELTKAYPSKPQYYIDKLAQGVGTIAAAFYPKPVIFRLSDFKSNEYANLIGGKQFEPKEDNPMIGWRGASRYYDPRYTAAFELECKAFLKAKYEMGLDNIELMIPFCRTISEGKKVLAEMKKYGVNHKKEDAKGFEVYVMCEIPANVILAEEFLDIFDGFSIGSNDLTQLTLGVDRDSELVAHVYDERNEAVKTLIKNVITIANKKGKHMGFCGQAVSDFPEMAQFVVDCGIETLSLNPDTVIETTLKIAETEKKLGIFPKR